MFVYGSQARGIVAYDHHKQAKLHRNEINLNLHCINSFGVAINYNLCSPPPKPENRIAGATKRKLPAFHLRRKPTKSTLTVQLIMQNCVNEFRVNYRERKLNTNENFVWVNGWRISEAECISIDNPVFCGSSNVERWIINYACISVHFVSQRLFIYLYFIP